MPSDSPASGPLVITVSGASGFIGRPLCAMLEAQGHTIRRLVRTTRDLRPGDIPWNPASGALDAGALEGTDAIIHLAGEPIAHRWTAERKRAIRDSRVQGTSLVASAVARMQRKPRVVLSGSAIGYYGNRGDEVLDESSTTGDDFLAGVVREWEAAAAPMAQAGVRLVLLRTGIVLSPDGGALQKMLPPFRLGAGGPLGNGRQWMSWITLADYLRAVRHCLDSPAVRGPVNLVAPEPATNADFSHALGHALHRPAAIPVPRLALELLFGEMADATILASQRVRPGVLAATGFNFEHPDLARGLSAVLAP